MARRRLRLGRTGRVRAMLAAVLTAVLLAGCTGAPGGSSASGGKVVVVATTTVFADMARQVAGTAAEVESIVPANGDVHTFEPTSADLRKVAAAKLLIMNGLGLDDWLAKTLTNAAAEHTPLVKLAVGLPNVSYISGDDPSNPNPHLWMSVGYAVSYVDRIAAGLEQVDAAHAATYTANASAYKERLQQLDAWVRQEIASIPQANRRFVSFHDAFPYYARAYGLTIVGVAVAAPGQDPSAAYTAQLISAIKAANVKAIFSEAQFPKQLVDQLAADTGATAVANLYDDALGDPPVTSYEAVMRWDTEQFVQALK